MNDTPPEPMTAEPWIPASRNLETLRKASKGCRGCPLWRHANQTVFGEGPQPARIMMIGEQPGDKEDLEGRPFVGPAGGVLDRALEEAGLKRSEVYLTNAVKHFKWTSPPGGGTRRLHARPKRAEVLACKPWLEAELVAVEPELIVVLGATAGQSLLGSGFRVTKERGRILHLPGLKASLLATIHPSAVLRMQTDDERREAFDELVRDLHVAAMAVAGKPKPYLS